MKNTYELGKQKQILMITEDMKDNWKFCNGDVKPHPNPWSKDYRCSECGSEKGFVNIIGKCSVKKVKSEQEEISNRNKRWKIS